MFVDESVEPVVVGIINPEYDLRDGGQAALVLGGDVQDVRGQGLDLTTDKDISAGRIHSKPLLSRLSWSCLLVLPLLGEQAVLQLGRPAVVQVFCKVNDNVYKTVALFLVCEYKLLVSTSYGDFYFLNFCGRFQIENIKISTVGQF